MTVPVNGVGTEPPFGFVAESPEMMKVRDLAARCAGSRSAVLIGGETGTGKEVLARFIHRQSDRATGPFVPVNCAALPDSLVDRELFGHMRGSFTGAFQSAPGIFEAANGGTLFLDEVGELPAAIQVKLLRVLQDNVVRRIGSQKDHQVDVRVVAATNRDIGAALDDGTLRQDLYYRLGVVEFRLPALRDRSGDIASLALHFLARYASQNRSHLTSLGDEALQLLLRYDWPGNVRELENVIERATVLAQAQDGVELLSSHLPPTIGRTSEPPAPLSDVESLALDPAVAQLRARYVAEALRRSRGNRSRAARMLGMSRRGLYYVLEEMQEQGRPVVQPQRAQSEAHPAPGGL